MVDVVNVDEQNKRIKETLEQYNIGEFFDFFIDQGFTYDMLMNREITEYDIIESIVPTLIRDNGNVIDDNRYVIDDDKINSLRKFINDAPDLLSFPTNMGPGEVIENPPLPTYPYPYEDDNEDIEGIEDIVIDEKSGGRKKQNHN